MLAGVNAAEILARCSRGCQEGFQLASAEIDLGAETVLDNGLGDVSQNLFPSGVVWRWVHNETHYVSLSCSRTELQSASRALPQSSVPVSKSASGRNATGLPSESC